MRGFRLQFLHCRLRGCLRRKAIEFEPSLGLRSFPGMVVCLAAVAVLDLGWHSVATLVLASWWCPSSSSMLVVVMEVLIESMVLFQVGVAADVHFCAVGIIKHFVGFVQDFQSFKV